MGLHYQYDIKDKKTALMYHEKACKLGCSTSCDEADELRKKLNE